jgi:hypothetical protein
MADKGGYRMIGYIISDKEEINIEEHEIQSFDILCKTSLNIFLVSNIKTLFRTNEVINTFLVHGEGNIQILEWFRNSGYEYKYNNIISFDWIFIDGYLQVLKWFINYGYKIKYSENSIYYAQMRGNINIIEWLYSKKIINLKKIIKWIVFSKFIKFKKSINFKTKNNYIKGYNKN